MFQHIQPMLSDIAAIALGYAAPRASVEATLQRLEQQGFRLSAPVQRIWAGERDPAALVAGLDPQDAELVQYILGLIDEAEAVARSPEKTVDAEALVASLPPEILAAIQDQDESAFDAALERLAPDQRQAVRDELDQLEVQAKATMREQVEAMHTALEGLPPDLRIAMLSQDPQAFQEALRNLPPDQAEAILEQLQEVGILDAPEEAQAAEDLNDFEPLLSAIASVARGDPTPRPPLEDLLANLEQQGWRLSAPVHRIWAGERELQALTQGLDGQEAYLVQRILDLI